MEFEILVNKDKISAQNIMMNTGNVNFYECRFHFSDEWNDFEKFAIFIKGEEKYLVCIMDNKCTIPFEVLENEEYISLGVFGTKGKEDDYVRISTNEIKMLLGKGAYAEGAEPQTPTPEVWESYVGMMSEAIKKAVPIIGENGNWFLWDAESESYVDSGFASKGEDAKEWVFDSVVTEGSTNPVTSDGVYNSIIGRKTEAGGEIFNDYENNQALSADSTAKGYSNIAGARGFTIVGQGIVDEESAKGYYVLDDVTGLAVGDVYSLKLNYAFPNQGTILEIAEAENKVIVDNYPNAQIQPNADNNVLENTFNINAKPWLGTKDIGYGAYAEGGENAALYDKSHAEGGRNKALGRYAHVEGQNTIAYYNGHAEGKSTKATGEISHAEGDRTIASGKQSHAEGQATTASGAGSHAEGSGSKATNFGAHAEGGNTEASGHTSHAEGANTKATKDQAHAEGYNTEASGSSSHAEGISTKALNRCSHVEGQGTVANRDYQHVQGRWNKYDKNYAHVVGNGTSDANRSNAHTLDWSGNAWFAGDVVAGEVSLQGLKEAIGEIETALDEIIAMQSGMGGETA